ncbi:MAG: SDR family oxidoreductase, partial [Clostridia bacterium]|nr:SDR family oxidoreductase [Clostridia bacterium]
MSNLFDYLTWRGDLSVGNAPICPVDTLLLSMLPYVRLEGFVPMLPSADPVRLADAVTAYLSDVSVEEDAKRIVAETIETYGKIDIMVNNAGIFRDTWGHFAESESKNWKRKLDINVLGTMYYAHEVLPNMLENHYGRIINVASVAGVYGIANMVDYSMTKGAVIAFTTADRK